jgi:hypothetical protein
MQLPQAILYLSIASLFVTVEAPLLSFHLWGNLCVVLIDFLGNGLLLFRCLGISSR